MLFLLYRKKQSLKGELVLKNKWTWIKSVLIPVILGGIVAFIIMPFMDYDTLQKPLFSPSGFLFGIVWTILYILMGISYGILDTRGLLDANINRIYYSQLVVNLIWPILFFVFKARLLSCFWIIILLLLIIDMIITFYKKHKFTAYLQIPYLIWTAFATYLNIGIYLLNK